MRGFAGYELRLDIFDEGALLSEQRENNARCMMMMLKKMAPMLLCCSFAEYEDLLARSPPHTQKVPFAGSACAAYCTLPCTGVSRARILPLLAGQPSTRQSENAARRVIVDDICDDSRYAQRIFLFIYYIFASAADITSPRFDQCSPPALVAL